MLEATGYLNLDYSMIGLR